MPVSLPWLRPRPPILERAGFMLSACELYFSNRFQRAMSGDVEGRSVLGIKWILTVSEPQPAVILYRQNSCKRIITLCTAAPKQRAAGCLRPRPVTGLGEIWEQKCKAKICCHKKQPVQALCSCSAATCWFPNAAHQQVFICGLPKWHAAFPGQLVLSEDTDFYPTPGSPLLS